MKVKFETYFNPNASQVVHFSIQPTPLLTLKSSEMEVIFHLTPHPYFYTRFHSTFNFL